MTHWVIHQYYDMLTPNDSFNNDLVKIQLRILNAIVVIFKTHVPNRKPKGTSAIVSHNRNITPLIITI